jgi:hypothetical protein
MDLCRGSRDGGESVRPGSLSRRGLLGAAGSAAAAAMLGTGAAPASAGLIPAAGRARLRPAALPGAGLVGATTLQQGTSTRYQQAVAFDTILGNGNPATYPVAVGAQEIFFQIGQYPTTVQSNMTGLQRAGCKFILCYKPAFNPVSPADKVSLGNSLAALKAAGVKGVVVLWQEPDLPQWDLSAAQYAAMVRYYSATVRTYYPLAYDIAFNQGMAGQAAYYPGDQYVDIVAVDFYANEYIYDGNKIDTMESLADNAVPPKPLAVYEFGVRDNQSQTLSHAQVRTFFHYLQNKMSARLSAGKTNGDVLWYDAKGLDNISAGDYKIPLLQSMFTTLSSAA